MTRGRRVGIGALLAVATLLWFVASLGVWANRQALNTTNWTDTSERLLRDEKVRVALSGFLLDRLYQSAPVETRLREVLPPRLQPLAAPAAAGLRQVASRNAPRILGSAAAVTAWAAANRTAHKALLRVLDGENGTVSLNLDAMLRQVAAGTGLPEGAIDKLPPNVAQLTVLQSDDLKTAQDGVDVLRGLPWVLAPLALILYGLAIFLHPDRRRAVVNVGLALMFAAIAVFAVRRIGGNVVVDQLVNAPNARPAVRDVWEIGTSLLAEVGEGVLLFGLLLVSGAWLAGPGRRATALRRVSAPGLREHPGVARGILGVALLLLVAWSPVPWTGRFAPVILLTIAAFVWLEWVRRSTLEEFPDVQAGELSRGMRSGMASLRGGSAGGGSLAQLEKLADLRDRGVLDEAEFQRQKTALLA